MCLRPCRVKGVSVGRKLFVGERNPSGLCEGQIFAHESFSALNINLDSSCSLIQPEDHDTSLRLSCFTSAEKPTSYCIRYLDPATKSVCSYRSLYDKLQLAKDETQASGMTLTFFL